MISVSTERQQFGPDGEPGVKVVLPLNYATPSAREFIPPSHHVLPFPTGAPWLYDYLVSLTSNSCLARETCRVDDRC